MITRTYNKYSQMMTATNGNTILPQDLQDIRMLNQAEIEIVSGGINWDEAIMDGFLIGGTLGSVFGAVVTGSSSGFASFGAFGAVIGFSYGSGWAVGSYLYKLANP